MVTTALVALALSAPWSRGTPESSAQPVYYVDSVDGGRAIRPSPMSDGGWALPVDIGAASVTINSGSGVYVLDAGVLNVSVSGVATAANQATGNASLSSVDGKLPALVSGRVPVDGSGVTQPISGSVGVSGTVTANAGSGTFTVSDGTGPMTVDGTVAATQSGTWTVQPGNTQNTTAWLTEGPKVASANNDGACVSVTSSATVLASNASRRVASVCASTANGALVHVKLGATATTGDFPLSAGQCMALGQGVVYTGQVDAIAASGTQLVCVVEL